MECLFKDLLQSVRLLDLSADLNAIRWHFNTISIWIPAREKASFLYIPLGGIDESTQNGGLLHT